MILIFHIFFNFIVGFFLFSSYISNFLLKIGGGDLLVCQSAVGLNECSLSSLFLLSVIQTKLIFIFCHILNKAGALNLVTSLLINIILSTFVLGFYNNIIEILIIENMSIELPGVINFIFGIAFFGFLNTIYSILYFKK